MTGSVIATHHGKYGKLLKGPEDQLMIDNNEIAGNAGGIGDAKTAKNAGDGGDTGDAGRAVNTRDTGEAGDKEVGRGNKGGKQKDAEVGNHEGGYRRD